MAVTARVHITEYRLQARDEKGNLVPAGNEPGLAEQVVAIGVASAQSAAFNGSTRFIRVDFDTACYFKIGSNPTAAAASSKYAAAGASEYFGVEQGAGHKLACIAVPA